MPTAQRNTSPTRSSVIGRSDGGGSRAAMASSLAAIRKRAVLASRVNVIKRHKIRLVSFQSTTDPHQIRAMAWRVERADNVLPIVWPIRARGRGGRSNSLEPKIIAAVAIASVRGELKSRLVAHGGHGAEEKAKIDMMYVVRLEDKSVVSVAP
jgi:hypothetical protein